MSRGEDRFASALETSLKPLWAMYRNIAWLEKRPGNEPADGLTLAVGIHTLRV